MCRFDPRRPGETLRDRLRRQTQEDFQDPSLNRDVVELRDLAGRKDRRARQRLMSSLYSQCRTGLVDGRDFGLQDGLTGVVL